MAQAEREQQKVSVWSEVRSRYSPAIQARVDAIVARGGLSLADIEAMEFAEHERIGEELDNEDLTATAISGLYSVRLQARKHLRTLRLAMSPIQTPNDARVTLPAAREALTDDDAGDELVH